MKILEINLAADFGPHLADGEEAAKFRMLRIDPFIAISERIVMDFSGVRNANSSFVNALVAGLIEQHGVGVLKYITFKGCNPVLRVLVEAAISLGAYKVAGKVGA